MFNFFKKKRKVITINCSTNFIEIEGNRLEFPTNYNRLVEVFGEPSRKINNSKNYIFWDELGLFCGCINTNEILSVSFYQNKKDKGEYNTTKQFIGKLFFDKQDITNNEFDKIQLGEVAIHRLGREEDFRFGFSLGLNKY